jgi:hypothetical protein
MNDFWYVQKHSAWWDKSLAERYKEEIYEKMLEVSFYFTIKCTFW